MVSALTVEHLSYRYPGRDTPALDDVTFDVSPGRFVFVLGPNGSGKSTLFRILLRLLKAQEGTVRIEGELLERFTPARLATAMSYIPQTHEVPFDYTVRHTVVLGRVARRGLNSAPRDDDWAAADRALEAVGISSFATRGIRQLSGGERQLVLIARALAQGGRLLVLDEPTSALDASNQIRVLQRLRRLVRDDGLTVVLSSHQPGHALEFADDVLLLKQGRALGVRPIDSVTADDLTTLYDLPMQVVTIPGTRLRVCIASHDEGDT